MKREPLSQLGSAEVLREIADLLREISAKLD